MYNVLQGIAISKWELEFGAKLNAICYMLVNDCLVVNVYDNTVYDNNSNNMTWRNSIKKKAIEMSTNTKWN